MQAVEWGKGKALNQDSFLVELNNYYARDTAKHPSAMAKHVSLARLHIQIMKK